MPLRVEVIASSVPETIASWASAQAAREGIDVGDLVARALDRERRRIDGGPPLDSRTRAVGRRGADARMNPGELHGGDVARLASTTVARVAQLSAAGCIVSARPTSRGNPAVYDRTDALVVAVIESMRRQGLPTAWDMSVAAAVRAAPRTRGAFVCVTDNKGVNLVGESGLAAHIAREGSAAVASLEALDARIGRAIMAA